MRFIQIILIILALISAAVYFARFRSVFRDRLIALLLTALGILFILFPGATTAIANVLGVGRGVDLLFYLFAMTGIFAFILLYSKVLDLETQQTELARFIALQLASEPERKIASAQPSVTPPGD